MSSPVRAKKPGRFARASVDSPRSDGRTSATRQATAPRIASAYGQPSDLRLEVEVGRGERADRRHELDREEGDPGRGQRRQHRERQRLDGRGQRQRARLRAAGQEQAVLAPPPPPDQRGDEDQAVGGEQRQLRERDEHARARDPDLPAGLLEQAVEPGRDDRRRDSARNALSELLLDALHGGFVVAELADVERACGGAGAPAGAKALGSLAQRGLRDDERPVGGHVLAAHAVEGELVVPPDRGRRVGDVVLAHDPGRDRLDRLRPLQRDGRANVESRCSGSLSRDDGLELSRIRLRPASRAQRRVAFDAVEEREHVAPPLARGDRVGLGDAVDRGRAGQRAPQLPDHALRRRFVAVDIGATRHVDARPPRRPRPRASVRGPPARPLPRTSVRPRAASPRAGSRRTRRRRAATRRASASRSAATALAASPLRPPFHPTTQ